VKETEENSETLKNLLQSNLYSTVMFSTKENDCNRQLIAYLRSVNPDC